jgi:hypothetical protein
LEIVTPVPFDTVRPDPFETVPFEKDILLEFILC